MVPATIKSDASLPELLHARALAAAPRRLVLDLAVGALLITLALWVRPKGWVALSSAGLCLAAYGLWAVAERHMQASTGEGSEWTEGIWRAARAGTAGLGLVALVALLFSLLGLTLGTWIS